MPTGTGDLIKIDAYAIECTLLGILSWLAVWKPMVPLKLFFIRSGDVSSRAETIFRFIAMACAIGATLAVLSRALNRGE